MKRVVFCFVAALGACLSADDEPAPVRKLPVKEFADQYDEQFRTYKPQVGDVAPLVTAWDADGNEFDLKQTRGKYTVLVFGCLT